jgi:O-antigen/teichoic acid export membrane protein
MSRKEEKPITRDYILTRGETITRGVFVILISQVIYLFLNYALFYYLGKKFIAGDFGNYQVGYRLILAFELALMYGIPVTVAKYVSEDPNYLGFFMGKGASLQLKFSAMLYFVYVIVAAILVLGVWRQGIPLFLIFIFAGTDIMVYAAYNIRMSILNPLRRFTREAFIVMGYSFSRFAATVALVEFGWGLTGAFIGNIISSIVGVILAYHLTRFKPGYREEPGLVKSIIAFITPNIVSMAVFKILIDTDLWSVMAFFRDHASIGQYKVGDYYGAIGTIAVIPLMLATAIYPPIFVSITHHLALGEKDKARKVITQTIKFLWIILVPVATVILASSRQVYSIMYPKFNSPGEFIQATTALGLLAYGVSAYSLYWTTGIIIIATGYPRYPMWNVICMVPLCLLLNAIFITILKPYGWGMFGAAMAVSCIGIIGNFFFGRWIYRYYGEYGKFLGFAKITFAAVLLYFISVVVRLGLIHAAHSFGWEPSVLTKFLLVIGIFVICIPLYLGLLILLRVFDADEMQKLDKLLRRFAFWMKPSDNAKP